MPTTISNAQEFEKVISYPETVVIYIYITECQFCKQMSPIFHDVAAAWESSNDKIVFATFNAENDEEILGTYGISAAPTTVIYQSGQEVSRLIGRKERDDFEKLLGAATAGGPKHGASHGHFNIAETRAVPNTISDGAVCSGIFKDRKSKPLSVLLGNNNKPFSDPEPECIIKPTPDLKGAQIGRANDGISYFSIRLWHEPGENPQKIFFGLDFMPDPVKERFQSARFEVSFARDDPQGQHPPLKILDMFPASTAHVDTTPYDNRSISTFSTSGVDLPSEQEIVNDTSTVVNGDGMLSPTAVWTFVEDENLKMKRGLDAHYTVSVTLPSVDRVWMKFYTKAILLGERIGPWRKVTLQSGSLEAPYKRILDLSE